MSEKRTKTKHRKAEQKQPKTAPKIDGRPVTTGDMQEVGAVEPEEVPQRQNVDGEAPVHEDPGNQNTG